jgi:hypothetical protein
LSRREATGLLEGRFSVKDIWAVLMALAAIVGIVGDQAGYGLASIDLCLALLGLGIVVYLGRGAPAARS